jgi:LuxR family transcriptional regulator, maltose regulon positive regulatory protein
MPQALLSGNLTVPPAPAYAVARPRLRRRLDDATAKALTIVEAPAGCGKTTMLADWADSTTRRAVWLTAESGSAQAFWHYVAAALGAEPDGGPDPVPALIEFLGHADAPLTLIVDEAHELDSTGVFDRLDYLVRHAAGHLRLILSTRTEPPMALHRWRVRDELTVIGPAELAFTLDETSEVLDRMGVVLSSADLGDLQRRTEGWPAGVCLSGLAVSDRTEPGDDRRLSGYLLGEILGGQPGHIRETLLDASILTRVNSDLLDAVTGRSDGRVRLDELAHRGVLISPIDQTQWYRVHPLLGAVLREELRHERADRLPVLHQRAAVWLADHDLATDALRHALATPDRDLALRIVAGHWPRLLPFGHHAEHSDPPPDRRTDPGLALAYAAERLSRHDCDGAEPYLRMAGDNPASDADSPGVQPPGIVFWLALAQLRGDVPETARIAGAITDRHADNDAAVAIALTARGTAELLTGDLSAAESSLREGYQQAIAAGLPCPATLCLSRRAYLLAIRGDLPEATRTAYAAVNRPPCPASAQPVHAAHAYLALGVAAFERGELAQAASEVDRAAELFEPTADPALAPTLGLLRARIATETGQWTEAQEALQAFRHPVLEDQLLAAEAELLTARGDPGAARTLLAVEPRTPSAAMAYAEACLRDHRGADGGETSDMPTVLRLRARLIESRAAWQRGERASARAALERALDLAEPLGLRRAFTASAAPERDLMLAHLDSGTAHGSFLADLLEPAPDTRVRGLLEPLTDREMTVLRYMQSILSNVEVAGEMCLSVNTVKTHVRNIYRKLGATRRRDAIRRARELQIL